MALSPAQLTRYSRQLILPAIGGRGQQRLLASRVVLGDLDTAGQTALLYLAAAGVGELAVHDQGVVDAPGPLFERADVGRARILAAAQRIARITPDARVVAAAMGDAVTVNVAKARDTVGAFAAGASAARVTLLALAATQP